MSLMKAYVKWIIVGFTLFFIIITFKKHWQSVTEISLNSQGWLFLFLALITTLIAHIWSAWVWLWILKLFQQSFTNQWGLKVYLITNIYKYLPGNVGHFYGRISAISQQGGSLAVASLSVLLEPLIMAAAALLIALLSHSLGLIKTTNNLGIFWLQGLALILVLMGIHPSIINRIIAFINKLKSQENIKKSSVYLERYPGNILLGELGFVLLRGLGFILVFRAFMPVNISQITVLLSSFSFAWLLGLIIPGAPGGMGVFEATIIAFFQSSNLPISIVLSAIAIFRIISILAELIGAGIGYLLGTLSSRHY